MVVTDSLSAHPCFKTLDPESCRILDRRCVWLKAAAGARVVIETGNDRDVYFVLTGRVRAGLRGVRLRLFSSDIEAGSFFGEMTVLEGAPRSLNVLALEDSTLAKMPGSVFVETVFAHRPLGEAVVANLVARNRAMTRRVAEAAHIYESGVPFVGLTPSRQAHGRPHLGADGRYLSGKRRRAR
jgi:CRP-like cAMP-binding protein